MHKKLIVILVVLAQMLWAAPDVRIKDITRIKGVRSNQLIGYGLVVGLNGTGDKSNIGILSAINMLKKFGIEADEKILKPKNVAAVMVTADLPPFMKEGERMDITVSSLGDATSLQGGVLLQTPLLAADSEVYAVASGALSVGVFGAGTGAGRNTSHLTVGKVIQGAIVEREVPVTFAGNGSLNLLLQKKDFTTASRIERSINDHFEMELAHALDAGEVVIRIPYSLRDSSSSFIAGVLALKVTPDEAARIVVNERTGTIVMGEDVKVSRVAIVHGDLKISIADDPDMAEGAGMIMEEGVDVNSLVKALNSIGASPGDIIAILQALKASGALHAELVTI